MRKRLGEFLLEKGWISQKALAKGLTIQVKQRILKGVPEAESLLGDILIKEKLIKKEHLTTFLTEQKKESTQNKTPATPEEKKEEEDEIQTDLKSLFNATKSTYPNTEAEVSNPPSSSISRMLKEENERYELIKELGKGGMGVVALVKDKLLGREVARKQILTNQLALNRLSQKQEKVLWRFYKEASITATLEHPNIIPFYEIQPQEEGEFQFTMRKVEGDTLKILLRKMKEGQLPYDENQLLNIFLKVCDAVSYAHSKGVIHRDLKPENIMTGEFGEVYVMDWGIAKRLNEDEDQEFFMQQKQQHTDYYKTIGGLGTPGYMAPEQMQEASTATPQSDIYALGRILQECYTLLSSFEEYKQILDQYSQEKASKESLNASLDKIVIEKTPKDIFAIIKKAMAKETTHRYQNVQAMTKDIHFYLNNFRVSARDYSFVEIVSKWSQRNRFKLVIVALITFLMLSFVGYSTWKKRRLAQEHLRESQQEIKRAQKLSAKDQYQRERKIEHLLNALNLLENALLYVPNQTSPQILKKKVCENLLPLAFKSKDFQLARYVAKSLASLTILTNPEKQHYLALVEKAKNAQLERHLKRLNYWITELKTKKATGTEDNALLEISKMPEQEIFIELKKIVAQGTRYFLRGENRSALLDEYYTTMAKALGMLEKPKATKLLLTSLKKLSKKMIQIPRAKRANSELNYMVALSNALVNSKSKRVSGAFNIIRYEMGLNHQFANATKYAYKRLLEFDFKNKQIANTSFALYKKGLFHFNQKEYQKALFCFNLLIEKNPNFSKAYSYSALTYEKLNKFDKALENWNRAVEINPHPNNYLNRGAFKLLALDHFQESIMDLNKAIELEPELVDAYRNRGIAKEGVKDYKGALEDFNKAIELDPKNTELLNNRAMLKRNLGKYSEALKDLNRCIEIEPNNADAYINKGHILQITGRFSLALKSFDKAIQLTPEMLISYVNRGVVKEKLGQLQEALLDFNHVIAIDPKFEKAYLNRAFVYQKLAKNYGKSGDDKKEKEYYLKALKGFQFYISLNPNDPKAYINRSKIYALHLKDYQKALEEVNKSIQLRPKASYFYKRSFIKLKLNDFLAAQKDLKRTLQLEPSYYPAYLSLAEIYKNRNEIDLAISTLEKAIKIKQEQKILTALKQLLEIKAIQKFRQKKYQKAKEYLLRVQQYNKPNSPEYLKTQKMLKKVESFNATQKK